jgi:hypothetical protein
MMQVLVTHNTNKGVTKEIIATVSSAVLLLGTVRGQGYRPSNVFVPDETAAVRVAEAVLVPVEEKKIDV